jgi:hypothetical protein
MTEGTTGGGPGGEVPAQRAPESVRWTPSTRYMCVGTYVDESFAHAVVEELEHEEHRACAPSYGVDLRPVLDHARRSLAAVRTRDLITSSAWVVALVFTPIAAVAWALLAKFTGMSAGQASRLPGLHRLTRAGTGHARLDKPVQELVNICAVTLVLTFVCTALQAPYPVWGVSTPFAVWLIVVVLLVAVPWWAAWRQQSELWETVSRELVPGARAPEPAAGAHLPPSAAGRPGNLVVYSGYRPFVGSGDEVSSWGLDLRLRPDPEATPTVKGVLGTDELLTRLSGDLARLDGPAHGVPRLTVEERVYVDGRELDGAEPFGRNTFWPVLADGRSARSTAGRPVDRLPAHAVAAARGRMDGPVRHCLCVQVASWDADVVLSVHLQAAVVTETLHVSSTASVLAPVREQFRQADHLTSRHRDEQTARLAYAALGASRAAAAQPLGRPARHLLRDHRTERAESLRRELIEHDRRYDFGARLSLRELASSGQYGNYFQRVDVQRISRQIELCVLSCLGRLLEQYGLDTSELEERRNVILNNGVIMTGGSLHGAVAAGAGATATASAGAVRKSVGQRNRPSRPDAS